MPKSNITDAYKIQYNMMKITAGWPEENSSVWYKLRASVSYLFSFTLCITMFMEAAKDITDFKKLSEILYILVTILTYVIKHTSFYYQNKTFVRMMKFLQTPIFQSYPDDLDYLMAKRIRFSNVLGNVYRSLILTVVVLFAVFPLFDNQPLPVPFPYDLGSYTKIMYVFQSISLAVSAWNNCCLDTLIAILIGISATELQILGKKIVGLREQSLTLAEKSEEECTENIDDMVAVGLKECIEHHMAIIEFVECIDRVFSFGILLQFMGSVFIICNTLFNFILVSIESSQFLLLLSYLLAKLSELFMHCWFGNDVIWQSVRIGEACYLSSWYKCGNKVRKYLMIMMERSKRPLKVTAFKFSTLSLTAFTTVIQWTYSYFALLMKLYNNNVEI